MKSKTARILLAAAALMAGVVSATPASAQQTKPSAETPERYSRVQFDSSFAELAYFLAESGLIAGVLNEDPVIVEASQSDLALADAAGLDYRVLIQDSAAYYAERAASEQSRPPLDARALVGQPSNFEVSPPGSMGGFYTFSQMVSELDQMAAFRPDLITAKQSIGTTLEGNPIWMVKISDNPSVDEPEPEVLYNSLIHGREPMSFTQNIFYMWHLLEEYDNDPDVKALVDNTEMYFIPIINADGYLYNEATNPGGGGLWRKNRRVNAGGTIGVDLNRNFGYLWGYDNVGSSPTPSSNTYRGTGPFSEPETTVLSNFVLGRNFEISLNYHSAVGLLLYPFGYDSAAGVADVRYPVLAEVMTRDNGYPYGTGIETLYATNGESSDWFWGGASVYGFTPEVGPTSSDFWPAPSQIVTLAEEWVDTNKMAARLAGVWADFENRSNSSSVTAGTSGQVDFAITRKGLDDAGTFTVTTTPLTANVTSTCAPSTFTGTAYDTEVLGSCSFDVAATAVIGDPIQLQVAINNGDYDIHTFVADFTVADPNAISVLSSSFDTGNDGFGYSDDTFRSTNQPSYATGQWNSTGGLTGGGVEVTLGGINGNDILGMSGGWTDSFNLAADSDVTITAQVDLRQAGTEESDELSQSLIAVDGALVGIPPNDYLAQLAGNGNTGPPITTGWQFVDLDLGPMLAGNHTITLGGYLSKKTLADEVTTIVFDDLSVIATPNAVANVDPTSVMTATPTTGDTPLAVAFDGTGSTDPDGTITNWDWDFGDGNTDTGLTVTHTYTAAGTYTATLTVTDNNGATATDTTTITVTAPPAAGLKAESAVVTGVGDVWQTIALTKTYTSPVVVATLRLPNSAATPIVTRVRNAGPNSFDLKVQAADGSGVSGIDVHYVVVEEGTYTVAADGVKMEAVKANSSVTAENNSWALEARSYQNSYSDPVVLGQVMTENDPAWSVFWASSATNRLNPPSAAGFAAGKHVAEDPTTTRADETIGYFVFESGSGTIDGLPFQAALTPDTVRGTGNTSVGYSYPLSAANPQAAVLSTSAMDGGDGGWPVLYGASPLTASALTMAVDEDQLLNAERAHTTEQVSYLVIDGAPLPSTLVAETAVAFGVTDAWQTVNLNKTYTSPVVVASLRLPDSTTAPVVTRVRNAGPNSFELKIQSPSGIAVGAYDVHYVVVEEGNYTVATDGVKMEAVRADSTVTAENGAWTLEARSYQNSYTSPVVVGQVMTENDVDWSVFWASSATSRLNPPDAAGFAAGKNVAEDPDAVRANETIGYLVFESGSGAIDGVGFDAGLGSDTVLGVADTTTGFDYVLNLSTTTVSAVVSAAAMDGVNGGWPVLYGPDPVSPETLTVAFDEDQVLDAERNHTSENVAYAVFSFTLNN